jgi:hypothetical protein
MQRGFDVQVQPQGGAMSELTTIKNRDQRYYAENRENA